MARSLYLSIIIASVLICTATPISSSESETTESGSFVKVITYIKDTIQQNKTVSGALALTPAALFYLCSSSSNKAELSLFLAASGLLTWVAYLTQPDSDAVIPTTTYPETACTDAPEKPWYRREIHHIAPAILEPTNTHDTTTKPQAPFVKRMEKHFVETMDQFS